MNQSHATTLRRALLIGAVAWITFASAGTDTLAQTPGASPTPPVFSCDTATPQASPNANQMVEMDAMATPSDSMEMMQVDFDLLYIDMMIPHHSSIIALSQAALPRLTDPVVKQIAQNTIDNQSVEITLLRQYRETFYGDPNPIPLTDAHEMSMMMTGMPDLGAESDMLFQMDAQAQVNAFCASDTPDLAFIDQTIPHHQMAIDASRMALRQAKHQEIKDFAQKVIDAQQSEIDQLTGVRVKLAP